MVLISVLSVVVAVIGLIISIPSYSLNRRATREANLRSAWMTFARDSSTLDHLYANGESGGLPALSESHRDFGGLLGYPQWCYSGGPLRTLNEGIRRISVLPENDKCDDWVTPRLKKAGLLPYHKWNLISNLRVVSGDGPQWSSRVFATRTLRGSYNDGFECDLYEGEFYDFFNTSVGLGVLAAFCHASDRPIDPSLRRLRDKLWSKSVDSGSLRVDVQGFFSLATLACLTIVVNDEGASMLVYRRGAEVADNKMMLGPVPSGSHSKFLDTDESVTFLDTLKREFAEELLAVDESGESPHRSIVEESVRGIVGEDNTYLLGVGFYPVQGYLSVVTMCVIDERTEAVQSWLARHDAESVLDVFTANYEGGLLVVPFERQEIDVIRRIRRRTPCLGEITRIVSEHFDEIAERILKPSDA